MAESLGLSSDAAAEALGTLLQVEIEAHSIEDPQALTIQVMEARRGLGLDTAEVIYEDTSIN